MLSIKQIARITLTVCGLTQALPATAASDELSVRAATEAEVDVLWQREDFAAIDRLAEKYRSTRERTPSGIWRLSVLNAGLTDAIENDRRAGKTWDEILEKTSRWQKVSPNSPIALMSRSRAMVVRAWEVRGGSFARDVSPERMETFRALIAASNAHLQSVRAIAARDPTWYEMSISHVTYSGGAVEEALRLYREAITREPEYLQAHFVTSTRHASKWGGSDAALAAFMNDAVNRLDPRAADSLYMRIAWWVLDNRLVQRKTLAQPDCGRMMRGARHIAADYPDPWNINNLAIFAAECGDVATTALMMDKIGDKPMREVWGRYPGHFQKVRDFVATTPR